MDLRIALAYHRSGQFEEAERAYRAACSSRPTDAEAWHLLGLFLFERGQVPGALDALEKSVLLAPSAADFRRNLGAVMGRLGRHVQAEALLLEALAIRPQDAQSLENFDLSDDATAALIRSQEIDILVDLAGHADGNRLPVFARQPAPIQVSTIGYPDTTGSNSIQYRITDAHQDPPGSEGFYTEQLERLPRTAWCYRPDPDSPPVAPTPALAAGHVTFGCLNRFAKVTDDSLRLWSRILARVPASRLILSMAGGEETNPSVRRRVERLGIPPDRFDVVPTVPRAQYLKRYASIDVSLDPIPYNGATTTCDALWMGVPVITLTGATNCSRHGVSLLNAAGLSEFAATMSDEYVSIAVSLANDVPALDRVRSGLRQRVALSALRDEAGFARAMEACYRRMWSNHCSPQ